MHVKFLCHYSGGWGRSYRRQHILTTCKNSSVWARLTDERVARDICVLYVGCVSLTIQGKRDLKALSSEKIMINKCIDYSHIIRWHLRKI